MENKPILHLTPPSLEQLPTVLSDASRIVVTAGAGTGKTRTLVARYLALLANDVPMRSIVAVTFTRKAAREMRNRVRHEIARYIASLDAQQQAQERTVWMNRYREIDGAHIGTIHSLCGMILRGSPAEAELDPLFEVLDDAQGVLARSDAIEQTMGMMADDELGSTLFTLLDEKPLRQILENLLSGGQAVRDAFHRLPESSEEIVALWQEQLEQDLRTVITSLTSQSEWLEACQTVLSIQPSSTNDKLYPAWASAKACIGELPEEVEALLPLFANLASINLQGGSQANWGGKENCAAVKAALKAMRDPIKVAKLDSLVFTELDQRLAEHMPALRHAYWTAVGLYQEAKARQRAIDYDDLEQHALHLLQNSSSVAERWQSQVRALLVDEFQDTNSSQLALIEALCGPHTSLFCVGDAKQSIYAFRGADVAVFRQLRQTTATTANDGTSLVVDLEESYRGHRPLIEALNALLEPVLGTSADESRPWREPFSGLTAHRQEPGGGFEEPFVEIQIVLGSKEADQADSKAADALAMRLRELISDEQHTLDESGETRPLNYGDIAVLCRTSSAFEAYEDAFERAGLPFYTVAGKGFYNRAEVRDLLNALAAIADPTDDLALCGFLRSPAVGASDAALFWLCQGRDSAVAGGESLALFALLSDHTSRETLLTPLTAHDRNAVEYGVTLLTTLHQEAGRVPVDQLITRLLAETGYLAALERTGGARSARNLQKLVRDAQSSGLTNLSRFLRHIDLLKQSDTREGEARAIEEGSITLMTVHAAKGLEFPVVVIGDAGHGNSRVRSPLIDDRLGPVIKLSDKEDEKLSSAVWQTASMRQQDMDEAESQRLLYVAATRARELLIVNGSANFVSAKSWLGMLTADLEGVSELFGKVKNAPGGTESEVLSYRSIPVRVTLYGREYAHNMPRSRVATNSAICRGKPALLGPIRGIVATIDEKSAEKEQDPPPKTWRVVYQGRERPNAWAVGSIVHDALAGWVYEPSESRSPLTAFVYQRAQAYGVVDEHAMDILQSQVWAFLDAYTTSELHQRVLHASRREHEVAYAVPALSIGQSDHELGIVDLMFLEDDTWHIVEFKTDRLRSDESYQDLLSNPKNDYCAKLEAYTTAANRLLADSVEAYLCFLRPGPPPVVLSLDKVRQIRAGTY